MYEINKLHGFVIRSVRCLNVALLMYIEHIVLT